MRGACVTMDMEYISLSDYARISGISIEEAKENLSTRENAAYIKILNGNTLVSMEIFNTGIEQEEPPPPPIEEPQQIPPPPKQEKEEIIELLTKEIEELKQEIREKDKQILEYGHKFAALAEQAQMIASQAQYLHAADRAAESAITEPEQHLEPPAVQEQDKPKEKVSFWRRIWGADNAKRKSRERKENFYSPMYGATHFSLSASAQNDKIPIC